LHYTRFLRTNRCRIFFQVVINYTYSVLNPYLRYIALKAQRNQGLREINIPAIQVHSYFGQKGITGFDKVFLSTQETMRKKYGRSHPRPETIPTSADCSVESLKSNKKLLGEVALYCTMPSTTLEISKRIMYNVDEVKQILIALKNKEIVKEFNGRFVLSIVADSPPSGSPNFEKAVVEAALKGWVETTARSEDIDEIPYATIIEDVKPKGRKSVHNILALDLLRAPSACPDEKEVQPGQLRFLFEEVYQSPLEEACLFATLGMPQSSGELRDETCSAPVNKILGNVWGKARDFGFINDELRTTPYGERVISTLVGTPLAPFRHIKTLLDYCSEPVTFEFPKNYRRDFMDVVYSGVLYEVLAKTCGMSKATQIMKNRTHAEYFISTVGTSDFYLPKKLANELEVDETSAKNALSQAFAYGACGFSTTSHPHLYRPSKKVGGA
jgi:hypothetical protein